MNNSIQNQSFEILQQQFLGKQEQTAAAPVDNLWKNNCLKYLTPPSNDLVINNNDLTTPTQYWVHSIQKQFEELNKQDFLKELDSKSISQQFQIFYYAIRIKINNLLSQENKHLLQKITELIADFDIFSKDSLYDLIIDDDEMNYRIIEAIELINEN